MKPAEVYILKQEEPLKSILMHLQLIIEANFLGVELLYKWKIPFYYLNDKPLCYFNATKKGFVDVGFYCNTILKKNEEFLVTKNRKAVKSLRYYTIDDINATILVEVLLEAYNIQT